MPNTGASIVGAIGAASGGRASGGRAAAVGHVLPGAVGAAAGASFATAPPASRPAAGLPEITPVDENADVFVFDGVDQVRTWPDPGAPRPPPRQSKTAKAKPGRRLADSMPSISKQKKKGFKKGSRSEPVMLGTPRKRADLTVEEAMLGTTEERTERAIDEADAKARAILRRAILRRAIRARNFPTRLGLAHSRWKPSASGSARPRVRRATQRRLPARTYSPNEVRQVRRAAAKGGDGLS